MLSTRAFRVASTLIGPRLTISHGGGTFSRLGVVRHLSTLDIPPPPTSHHPHKAMPGAKGTIIYTETDEAPALATYSLLPVIVKVCMYVGVRMMVGPGIWSDDPNFSNCCVSLSLSTHS